MPGPFTINIIVTALENKSSYWYTVYIYSQVMQIFLNKVITWARCQACYNVELFHAPQKRNVTAHAVANFQSHKYCIDSSLNDHETVRYAAAVIDKVNFHSATIFHVTPTLQLRHAHGTWKVHHITARFLLLRGCRFKYYGNDADAWPRHASMWVSKQDNIYRGGCELT